ncbi:MAG: DNA mismatch repair endonuclease MutL [Gammaproteobacteria bacterium]|nr:DNA mismatch repair endonuclease MutL [Gammaproteobacteria bacterium]
MKRVQKLALDVYGKIAAGEVIERPASIVRELVDNSIDAKASKIEIEVEWEEDFSIRIKDDGVGIHSEDLPLAIERHTTSKIRDFNDIYSTPTHGFRGEALASIVSIAKTEIISCLDESGRGSKLTCANSKAESQEAVSYPKGTNIFISEVFANTPVRKKFLKSAASEKSEIKKEIIRQVLGTKQIQIIYRVKNAGKWKEEISIPKSYGLKEKIAYLFNKDIYQNLIDLETWTDRGFKISGFISSHRYKAKTRKDQYFLVKNRVVQNATIASAFNNAYINVLPVRNYPACFLFIESISSFVDMNVHPQKKDVKFQENDSIYSIIYHRIKDVLYKSVYSSQRSSLAESVYNAPSSPNTKLTLAESSVNVNYDKSLKKENESKYDIFQKNEGTENQIKLFSNLSKETNQGDENELSKKLEIKAAIPHTDLSDFDELKKEIHFENPLNQSAKKSDLPNFLVLGQIADAYIVYSLGLDLYIADQHAIHERINYDNLKQKVEKNEVEYQNFLIPLTIEKSKSDVEVILERKSYLETLGITIEKFGEKLIKIEKVPAFMPKGKEADFISDILDLVVENQYLNKSEILEKVLSTTACRMSIMAGDKMTVGQMEDLIRALYREDYIHNCPHGRPFVKKIGFNEMSRFFERH